MGFFRKPIRLSSRTPKNVLFVFFLFCAAIVFHLWIFQNLFIFFDNVQTMIGVKRQKILKETVNMKYILLWHKHHSFFEHPYKPGSRSFFPDFNCSVSNCIFTDNKGLLGDYSLFDAIIFNEQHLYNGSERPTRRSPNQLYIFASNESPTTAPACDLRNDNFFNWTFTYRLDSDVVWYFFVVRNVKREIVAPNKTVSWHIYKHPIDAGILSLFQYRKKAAAWIVSHCDALSLRDDYLSELQVHLHHYSLELDVYGKCNHAKCDNNDCNRMLRNDYYFYMAFENSFAEDYLTEKVLHGYNNYVVPIVFGGANYSRFLPPGSYIDARRYHPYNLARKIHLAVTKPEVYLSYFYWTNFYTIDPPGYLGYRPQCNLCEALHNQKGQKSPPKPNFRIWWNSLKGMKWCLPSEYWNEKSRTQIDGSFIYSNNGIKSNAVSIHGPSDDESL